MIQDTQHVRYTLILATYLSMLLFFYFTKVSTTESSQQPMQAKLMLSTIKDKAPCRPRIDNHNQTIGDPFAAKVARLYRPPQSCTKHCAEQSSIPVHLPSHITCSTSAACIYTSFFTIHSDVRATKKATIKVAPFCVRKDLMMCPPPTLGDCDDFGWTVWQLRAYITDYVYESWTQHLQVRNTEPFSIKAIYPSEYPSMVQVVAFYLPSLILPRGCNTLFCFYEFPSGSIERYEATNGDMSFAFCPKPSQADEATLRLSYDHKIFSEPFNYSVQALPAIPNKYLTICALTLHDGPYLQEWIEHHLLMKADRIVLYDANPTPDHQTEEIVKMYHKHVMHIRWPHLGAQTEASTDCIVRFGGSTRWMSILDVDEFLVPSRRYNDMHEALETEYSDAVYLHSHWMVFGPCKESTAEKHLVLERCTNVTKADRNYGKSVFRPAYASGIQGYGNYFVRMRSDIGNRLRSEYIVSDNTFVIYHYRMKSMKEYMMSRKHGSLPRLARWTEEGLLKDWEKGLKESQPLLSTKNNMMRFRKEIKRNIRVKKRAWLKNREKAATKKQN